MPTVMCTQKIGKTSDDEILMQTIFHEHLTIFFTQSDPLYRHALYKNYRVTWITFASYKVGK